MRSTLTPNHQPSCDSPSDGSSVGRRLRSAAVVVLSLVSTLLPLSVGVAHAAPAVAQQKGSVPQLDRVAWTALMALEEISNGVRVDRPPVLSAKYVALRSQVAALVAIVTRSDFAAGLDDREAAYQSRFAGPISVPPLGQGNGFLRKTQLVILVA